MVIRGSGPTGAHRVSPEDWIAYNHKLSKRGLVHTLADLGATPTDVRIHQVAAATDPEDTSEAMT